MERIGPYQLRGEIARTPGVTLFEADAPDGAATLLHVVALRAADTEDDRLQRQRYERQVAGRTAALIDEPEIPVHAHGSADGPGGTRLLFWAQPLRRPAQGPLGEEELVALALDLLKRLARRHAKGRLDPHLSAELLGRGPPPNGADVLGVPIALGASWLAPGAAAFCAAPEENGEPTRAGDLWRAGRALLTLAGGQVSDRVRRALETLSDPTPAARPATPEDALALLLAARSGGETEPPADWGEAVDRADPTPSNGTPVRADEREGQAELATARIDLLRPPRTSRPPPEGETVVRDPDAAPRNDALPVGPEAVTRELRARGVSTSTGEAAALPPDPSEQNTSLDAFSDPAPSEVTPTDVGMAPRPVLPTDPVLVHPGEADADPPVAPDRVRAATEAWSPSMLPEGASPWSEVVRPRAAPGRRASEFPGFEGELPEVVERAVLEQRITLPPPALTPPPPPPVPAGKRTFEASLAARKAALAATAVLVVCGAFAWIVRSAGRPIEAVGGLLVPAAHQVTLHTQPSGAMVIAEADGEILGATPLELLIPSGAEPVILLVAPGHDPQRLVLPERGRLTADLAPLSPNRCTITVEGPPLEGVAAAIGDGPALSITGAAVVRPRAGDQIGARIVRCPDSGGEAPRLRFAQKRPPVQIRVTHPPGASAEVNGVPIGPLPALATSDRAFSRVMVTDGQGRSVERWVPTTTDVEVQMPALEVQRVHVTMAPEEAIELSEPSSPGRAGDKKSRALVLAKRGNQELLEGRRDDAQRTLASCIRIDPAAAECHRLLGSVFRQANARQQAMAHYERYLELAPDAPDAPFIRRILRQWE